MGDAMLSAEDIESRSGKAMHNIERKNEIRLTARASGFTPFSISETQ